MGNKRLPEKSGNRLTLALFATLIALAQLLLAYSTTAVAQERRTLFDVLFGGKKVERAERAGPARNSGTRRSSNVVRVPEPEAVDKLENARVVLVVGDFLADGLAEGLVTAYAQSPGIRIVSSTSGSSGLVRDDYYDWPAAIGPIIEEQKPSIVIVMVGSNDRQQLVVEGNREKVRSAKWTEEYGARAERLAKEIRDRGLPLLWVGLPSFKAGSMSNDMLAFNDVYRGVVEAAGGQFIDIWDGFVDENGAFSSVGPDMNGQRVRLRGSDGINLTRDGKRKVAFYVERPLNRLLGSAVGAGVASLGLEPLAPLDITPEEIPEITRTSPVALGGAELDGGDSLLGATGTQLRREARTPGEKLSMEGIAPPPKEGRADNFFAPPYVALPGAPADAETTTSINR
ncbi:MAG: DUF459 domain-containing protein [Rhizobiaceae bacterium]|nr:DUF459 domain-containing protein [Rhizobiaceae bacterium]